jgi:pimeloyl-ACP methyl ester carboxylesterase
MRGAAMKEKAALFGESRSMLGILTDPVIEAGKNHQPAIIFLNAGILHRVGPNRIHVTTAREMAQAGYCAFRFDFSGVGDSSVRMDNLPTEKSMVSETKDAMDYLNSAKGVNQFILAGICSGADAAFKTAYEDPRVVGLVMINGFNMTRSVEELVPDIRMSIQGRYYRKKIFNVDSWRRLLTGKSDIHRMKSFFWNKIKRISKGKQRNVYDGSFVSDLNILADRGVDSCLIYSEGSSAFDLFKSAYGDMSHSTNISGRLFVEIIQNTDHVFTLYWSQKYLIDLLHRWIEDKQRGWRAGRVTEAVQDRRYPGE